MLNKHALLKYFGAEAIETLCYILNHVLIRPSLIKLYKNFGLVKILLLVISKCLVANVLF